MKLRVDIFVVEQQCPYPELDGKDVVNGTYHLLGYEGDMLVAYSRLLGKQVNGPWVSFGRVAVAQSARNRAIGHRLLEETLSRCDQLWPGETLKIGAQVYLQAFYEQYGFKRVSDNYLEDGIPHVDMLRAAKLASQRLIVE